MKSQLVSFLGNEKSKRTLVFLAKGGRFPHAVLLEGAAGMGKKTFALWLAAVLLCEKNEDEPCGQCSACQKIGRGTHPDVNCIEPDGASFKKEQIEQIRAGVWVKPNEADKKIYILTEIQTMTAQAQNALLKILEEPPANVLFLLTCENKSALLATVLSRVMTFSLTPPPREEQADFLKKAVPDKPPDQIESAILLGETLGEAADILSDPAYAALCENANAADRFFSSGECVALLQLLQSYEKDRAALLLFLRKWQKAGMLSVQKLETSGAQTATIQPLQLLQLLAIIRQGETYARRNMNLTLLCSWLGAKAVGILER